MKQFVHPPLEDITLAGLLAALADPIRLSIVQRLHQAKGKQGLCCNDAAPCPSLPKSTLSNHFRVLRESGLIRTEKCGIEHISHLRRAEIDQKFPGLLKLVLKLSDTEN
jgi:DNA-binding transcriptional ArsR family regulator